MEFFAIGTFFPSCYKTTELLTWTQVLHGSEQDWFYMDLLLLGSASGSLSLLRISRNSA